MARLRVGSVLLGVWMVLSSLTVLIRVSKLVPVPYRDIALSVLALVAGIFLILGR